MSALCPLGKTRFLKPSQRALSPEAWGAVKGDRRSQFVVFWILFLILSSYFRDRLFFQLSQCTWLSNDQQKTMGRSTGKSECCCRVVEGVNFPSLYVPQPHVCPLQKPFPRCSSATYLPFRNASPGCILCVCVCACILPCVLSMCGQFLH